MITRTPFRISFCGGGTDIREFYSRFGGAVISTTIDKYMYITVNKRFENSHRISYHKTEFAKTPDEIEHPIVRESLRFLNWKVPLEIISMADVPKGTGLGSSSSFNVGLLNALHAFSGNPKSAEELAKQACLIERDMVKEPGGKQDQYAAAYGGFNFIRFNEDETVFVDPVICSQKTRQELQKNIIIFYTGTSRESREILSEQKAKTETNLEFLQRMKELAFAARDAVQHNNLLDFASMLHESWLLKRKLASSITNNSIDALYEKARGAGALGGKIVGAGGGGFLLLYCEDDYKDKVRNALSPLVEMPFAFEPQGTKIIYVSD